MSTMRISQLAERTGVPATTLRFYEASGLLRADRTGSNYRVFGEEAVRRLAFIDTAKRLGLALPEIAELLAVWESGACVQVKADLRPRIAARLADAEQRTAELATFSDALRGALAHLDVLPDRAEPCDPKCVFLAPTLGAEVSSAVEVRLSADRSAARAEAEAEAERWRTAPVACDLSDQDIRERVTQWNAVLADAVRTEIPEGLRLTVPVERVAQVAALAAAEQRCCAFFDFRLHLDGADLHLEVRAPAEGAALLDELFARPV
jgi:MerR family transcriptional regulator, copper efflux regulator